MGEEFIDIIIIGAGISGIGSAYHLQNNCPGKTLAILEARDAIGGTWDLFRYPGIRSDSDMYTYGFDFKPWMDKSSFASGEKILNYLRETIEENNIKQNIRLEHKVQKLEWSSHSADWTVKVKVKDEIKIIKSKFVLCCNGYYDYEKGYQPEFKNKEAFTGDFIHPQHWPENLDYSNKNIVVIGSGATAVTLVPSLAEKAKHVILLQRSPSYIVSMPMQDILLRLLHKILPKVWVSRFARARNVFINRFFYDCMVKYPEWAKKMIRKKQNKILSPDIDRKHFTPDYNPWDQRVCLVPDDDLFKALNSGKASIITEHIDSLTPGGIKLVSGEELEADIIVSATGLKVKFMSGIDFSVDGKKVAFGEKMFYRGILLEGVPNFGFVFGYTNASWTLKVGLVSQYLSRIINHMDDVKRPICIPSDKCNVDREEFVDLQSGYVQRALKEIPKQGAVQPWRLDQSYYVDKARLRDVQIEDGVLEFRSCGAS